MTILHLTPSYSPHKGGVETHLAMVNAQLQQRGHVITVITQQKASEPLTQVLSADAQAHTSHSASISDISHATKNTKTKTLSSITKPAQSPITITRMPRQCVNNKIATWQWLWQHKQMLNSADAIIIHDVFWWVVPLVGSIVPAVYVVHHGWEGDYPVRWQAKLQRWLASWYATKTLHVGQYIQEFYWDTPDYITYGGVQEALLASSVHTTATARSLLPRVAFVGRLVPENSIAAYCELITLLKAEYPSLEMTWIGDGPLRSMCKQYGVVTGMISDTRPLLAQADIVLASSYLALFEAQALGKVVCALYGHRLKQRYIETYPCATSAVVASTPYSAMQQLAVLLKNKKKFHSLGMTARQCVAPHTWQAVADIYQQMILAGLRHRR